MTTFQRLGVGLNLAFDSFTLLWQHMHLLLYPLIPSLTGFVLQLIIGQMVTKPYFMAPTLDGALQVLVHTIQEPDTAAYIVLNFLAAFVAKYAIIFFNAALIYHAAHIIRTRDISMSESLSFCARKWLPLLQWTILVVIAQAILDLPEAFVASVFQSLVFASILAAFFNLLFSLATFLVIPFIIFNTMPVVQALGVSWAMVKTYIGELVGGMSWIGLVAVVLGIVSLPLHVFLLTQGYVLALIVVGIDILIAAVITTSKMIFKAKLYDTYYEQPLEDVARTMQEWEY